MSTGRPCWNCHGTIEAQRPRYAILCATCAVERQEEYGRKCKRCEVNISHRHHNATLCEPCADEARREADRKRSKKRVAARKKARGEKVKGRRCDMCGVDLDGTHLNRKYCEPCAEVVKKEDDALRKASKRDSTTPHIAPPKAKPTPARRRRSPLDSVFERPRHKESAALSVYRKGPTGGVGY